MTKKKKNHTQHRTQESTHYFCTLQQLSVPQEVLPAADNELTFSTTAGLPPLAKDAALAFHHFSFQRRPFWFPTSIGEWRLCSACLPYPYLLRLVWRSASDKRREILLGVEQTEETWGTGEGDE